MGTKNVVYYCPDCGQATVRVSRKPGTDYVAVCTNPKCGHTWQHIANTYTYVHWATKVPMAKDPLMVSNGEIGQVLKPAEIRNGQ